MGKKQRKIQEVHQKDAEELKREESKYNIYENYNKYICNNDILLKGFKVQLHLFDILCRFRLFSFGLITNIKKTYSQIHFNPGQSFVQNTLWRCNPNLPLQWIELESVTNFASYLAANAI